MAGTWEDQEKIFEHYQPCKDMNITDADEQWPTTLLLIDVPGLAHDICDVICGCLVNARHMM